MEQKENEVETVEAAESETEVVSTEEATQEAEESCETKKPRPKGKKQAVAKAIISEAQREVISAEEEIAECLDNIRRDLEAFEAYERAEVAPVLKESHTLLQQTGIGELPEKPLPGERVDLENPEVEKIEIKPLSSGRFGAFFTGLIAAAATVGGWYYFAATKMGLPLVPKTLPTPDEAKAMLATVSEVVKDLGLGTGFEIGAAIVGGSALLALWIVYAVMVSMRASKNLRIAEKMEEEASFYCTKKKECKEKMKLVREHLNDLGKLVKKYEAVLRENNAGLKRAFVIEGTQSFGGLHARTQELARSTQSLLDAVETLLATPMAQSGMLTMESANELAKAESLLNEYLEKLYGGSIG